MGGRAQRRRRQREGEWDVVPFARQALKVLRRSDWDLDLKWLSPEEMAAYFMDSGDDKSSAYQGAISASAATSCANASKEGAASIENMSFEVRLRRGAFRAQEDAEIALTHELVHMLFWGVAPSDDDHLRWMLMEQGINSMDSALHAGIKAKMRKAKR